MYRRHRQIQIRTVDEPASQPFKWALALVIFILALTVTFSDVGGDGVGNPYEGGFVNDAALQKIFVVPQHQTATGEKVPNLLKRR